MADIRCEISDSNPPFNEIKRILKKCKKIAIVGISPKEERDSNKVAKYLIEQGYEVVPVNPGQKEVLGRRCFKAFQDIPFQVDLANLFLNPSRVPLVVDQIIEKGVNVIWMQLGVIHNESAEKAREAGIQVVMDKCIKVEHMKMVK
jgi:hypothetical protein